MPLSAGAVAAKPAVTLSFAQVVLATANLKGYWKFNDASGAVLDYTVNARNGTVTGASYRGQAGPDGDSYMTFDGSNDGVEMADHNDWSLPASGGFTIMVMARPTNGNNNRWLGKEGTSAGEWNLQGAAGSFLSAVSITSGLSTIRERPASVVPAQNAWSMLLIEFPDQTSTAPDFYLNGTLRNGSPAGSGGTYTNGTAPLSWGGVSRLPSSFRFGGALAHGAIWNPKLSSGDRALVFAAADTAGWF